MKIVILSHAFEHTGAPVACLSLALAAKALGHTVEVFSRAAGPLARDLGEHGIPPVKVVHAGYDLYITSTAVMLPYAHRLRELGKRVVPIIHEMTDYSGFADRPSEYDHRSWMLEKFDFCVCVSVAQRDAFRRDFPTARLLLLEYCCMADVLREEAVPGLPQRYFVYPGGFERRKGHDQLARQIMASDAARHEVFVLLGASKEEVAACRMPAEIRGAFRATGFIRPAQALRVIRDSAGLVSFSLSETKGLSVMDALWYGKRALLRPIPAFRTFGWSPLVRFSDAAAPYDPSDLENFITDARTPPAEAELRENERTIQGVHSSASYEARVDMLLGLMAR